MGRRRGRERVGGGGMGRFEEGGGEGEVGEGKEKGVGMGLEWMEEGMGRERGEDG